MERNAATHTVPTRISHWANALLVVFLLVTGFLRYFHLHVSVPKRELFTWHTYAGAGFASVGVAYVASLIVTGGWKRIVPNGKLWVHDPARPLAYTVPQRIAYTSAFVGAAVMVLTGVSMWFKHQIPWLMASLGGEHVVLRVHLWLSFALLGFIGVHVAQVLRAGITTLRSMTVGQTSEGGFSGSRILRTR